MRARWETAQSDACRALLLFYSCRVHPNVLGLPPVTKKKKLPFPHFRVHTREYDDAMENAIPIALNPVACPIHPGTQLVCRRCANSVAGKKTSAKKRAASRKNAQKASKALAKKRKLNGKAPRD